MGILTAYNSKLDDQHLKNDYDVEKQGSHEENNSVSDRITICNNSCIREH